MSELLDIFESEHLTNVSNYSGVYDPQASYQKFDFVYNTGDGMFYYAREDMAVAGIVEVSAANRFTLDPGGPVEDGIDTYYIYDNLNSPQGQEFFVGQNISISGSIEGSDGDYQIINIEKDFEVEIILGAENNLLSVMSATSLGDGWYESDWFFKPNLGETKEINVGQFYKNRENLIYHAFWGWTFVSLLGNQEKELWFYPQEIGMWFWAANSSLGSSNINENSFVYLGDSENSTLGPEGWTEWFGLEDYRVNTDSQYYPFDLDGYSSAIVYLGEKLDANIVTVEWNNSTLEVDQSTYDSLPEFTYFRRRGSVKWIVLGQDAFLKNYKAIIKNNTDGNFYAMNDDFTFEQIADPSIIVNNPPNQVAPDRTSLNKKTRIQIKGEDSIDSVKQYEPYGDNTITLSTYSKNITDNIDSWSQNLFFFDADYGSTVSFRANNHKHEYGNGYYILQPKNINSLTLEADLKFKNRTNREANAMIHFLENHQGQHEQDRPSANLKYSQGISGFRWDGASTFHPYDNTEIQTKKFYCSDFNHSLNFENSNDVAVKLRNLDSSILQKQNGLFVAPADEYSDTEYYEKNDVVYNVDNKRFYYWSGDSSAAGKAPTQSQANWTRADGYHKDTNTEYWTREFFWKPSVGLNVNQKPRLNEIGMGQGYTQIYDDGINESLLTLDLQFNNRSDTEAYAILHFLEQRLGCLPFSFSPPAPYDKKQNFVCQEWSHTYNYKNNHSISARFEQYPFNLSDQAYDNAVGPPIESDGELLFTSPAIIKGKDIGEELSLDTSIRGRVVLRNVGDKAVTLYSATITPEEQVTFKILGQSGGDVPILKKQLISSDYEYVLPPYSASVDLRGGTIDLNNKRIKLRKNFTGGLEGGYMFDLLDSPGGTFVQYNNGVIRSLDNPNEKIETNYFINEIFIQNNKTNILGGGEEAYIEIVFEGVNRSDLLYNLIDENGNRIQNVDPGGSQGDIVLFAENKYYNANLSISSSSKYGTKDGLVKVYVNVD